MLIIKELLELPGRVNNLREIVIKQDQIINRFVKMFNTEIKSMGEDIERLDGKLIVESKRFTEQMIHYIDQLQQLKYTNDKLREENATAISNSKDAYLDAVDSVGDVFQAVEHTLKSKNERHIKEIEQKLTRDIELKFNVLKPKPSKPKSKTDNIDYKILTRRTAIVLKIEGIKTYSDLSTKTEAELLRFRNFGRKSLNEVKEVLANHGLRLGMKV